MGGAQKEYDRRIQSEKLSKDLNVVEFYIFYPEGNAILFDNDKLYKDICREITVYFTKNGIKNKDIGPVSMGGGGTLTLIEIIKTLWQHKDLLLFAISLGKFTIKSYKDYLNNNARYLSPCIQLGARIQSNSPTDKLDSKDLEYLVIRKLANLISVGEAALSKVQKERSFLRCNFVVESQILDRNYSVRFNIKNEQRNNGYYDRIMNLVKNLKIRDNFSSIYETTYWKTIRREDRWDIKKRKTYYLLDSSRIVPMLP